MKYLFEGNFGTHTKLDSKTYGVFNNPSNRIIVDGTAKYKVDPFNSRRYTGKNISWVIGTEKTTLEVEILDSVPTNIFNIFIPLLYVDLDTLDILYYLKSFNSVGAFVKLDNLKECIPSFKNIPKSRYSGILLEVFGMRESMLRYALTYLHLNGESYCSRLRGLLMSNVYKVSEMDLYKDMYLISKETEFSIIVEFLKSKDCTTVDLWQDSLPVLLNNIVVDLLSSLVDVLRESFVFIRELDSFLSYIELRQPTLGARTLKDFDYLKKHPISYSYEDISFVDSKIQILSVQKSLLKYPSIFQEQIETLEKHSGITRNYLNYGLAELLNSFYPDLMCVSEFRVSIAKKYIRSHKELFSVDYIEEITQEEIDNPYSSVVSNRVDKNLSLISSLSLIYKYTNKLNMCFKSK